MATIATEADYDMALETVVEAFEADPLWSWMFPDPRKRAEQHATVFGLYVESALPRGGVWMTDEGASAVAVFTHPGDPELSEDAEARREPAFIEALGDLAPPRLETLDRFTAAVPPGSFYYLSLLGVRNDSRGRGIGMGLLAELVAEADRDGQPTYLESTNPDNNRRYERLGFEAQSSFTTPDDLHTVTTMWREPVSR